MTGTVTAKFHLPPQDLEAPTLFPPKCEAVKAWLAGLPKTNLGQSTRQLFNAITEVNRVRMLPGLRLQIVEELRPAIYLSTQGLRRHYLNQSVELPEQAQKVAQLAHVLHEQLATGYILVAMHTLTLGKQSGFSQPGPAMATAVHRALVEHSQNLLRDYQLYRNPHAGCWATLHQLYKFAQTHELRSSIIADSECGDSTIEAAYLRAILLGSSHPNQLRQEHLNKLFLNALDWVAQIKTAAPTAALFVVNPDSDDGPTYREFAEVAANWVGYDTTALAQSLNAQRDVAEQQPLNSQMPPAELLELLAQTWSSLATRSHTRVNVREEIEIALGMTATHHFISGEQDFNLLLNEDGFAKLAKNDEKLFQQQRTTHNNRQSIHDVWSSPYEPRFGEMKVSLELIDTQIRDQYQKVNFEKDREKLQRQKVQRVNVSPGGLCITWPPNGHVQLRNGELVGIRERRQTNWSIGVVRWTQLTEGGPRLGIEMVSPAAIPYGARVVAKTDKSGEYQRVLLLPEIQQINQPTTLLAPRLPFRVGQKVSLLRNGKETRIQLTKKISSTPAFNQFEFRRLSSTNNDSVSESTKSVTRDTGFDSLWDSL